VGGAGVSAGLLALLQLVWSLLQPRADTERTTPLHRVLRQRQATWLLGPLLVASMLLLGLTGSYWLTLEEGSPEDAAVVTFTPPEGLPFAKGGELRVSRDAPVAGGPFLFPIRGLVKPSVQAPPGWELQTPVCFGSGFRSTSGSRPASTAARLGTGHRARPDLAGCERCARPDVQATVTIAKEARVPAGGARRSSCGCGRAVYLGASGEVLEQIAARSCEVRDRSSRPARSTRRPGSGSPGGPTRTGS
jgi:hypothetical protein